VSRAPRSYRVLGFASTHDALDAEALLDDLGIAVTPIPTPRSLGSLCGIALRLEPADAERAQRYLADASISVASSADIDDV
jgi:Protein of unknown function (DUF3343)